MEEEGEKPAKHPVCYVLVRRDVSRTRQGIDTAHAAQECVRVAPVDKRTAIRWLWVKDEAELLAYAEKLKRKGFNHDVVNEPDAPWCGQAMSLATEPISERVSALGKVFFHLERVNHDAGVELDGAALTGVRSLLHEIEEGETLDEHRGLTEAEVAAVRALLAKLWEAAP